MRLKQLNKTLLLVIAILVILAGYGLYMYATVYSQSAKDRAISEARTYVTTYHPGPMCKFKTTISKHSKTGVLYSFPSTCLPAGWQAENK